MINSISFLTCFFLFFSQSSLLAYHDLPPCYRDLEEHFFIPEVTAKALSLHNIYQSQWDIIVRDLQLRSSEVHGIVDARASRMYPDPLNSPIQTEVAKELILQVLFEIFADVLYSRNYTSQSDIREMFNYIRRQQADRIKACFPPPPPQQT